MSSDREERVRQRAHEIWLREGRPDGHGPRHWIEAEGEIDAEDAAARAKPAARPKPAAKPKAAAKTAASKAKPAKKSAK